MAGVAFEAARTNAFVEIEQSRIEGPFQAGVLFAGPTEDVTVQQTRFYAMADGVRYAPIKLQASLRAAVVGNTFYKTLRGLRFRELPPAATSHLTIQNNLFLDVDRLALVDGLTLAPADVNGQWIWAADDMKANSPVVPRDSRASSARRSS